MARWLTHPLSRNPGKRLSLFITGLLLMLPVLASAQVMGTGTGTSVRQEPEITANTAALQTIENEIMQRRAQQRQSPVYRELIQGNSAMAQMLRATRDIALQYVDENGRPVFYTIDNVNAAKTIATDKVNPGGSSPYNMSGSLTSANELGEWDAGSALSTHQELTGRITLGDGAASHYHSTHVAGTMIASGVDAAAKGMSYAAGGMKSYEWTNDSAEMAAAAAAGMMTSNHSYGWGLGWTFDSTYGWIWYGDINVSTTEDPYFGSYVQDAVDWDNVAFNAPQYLIVKAAGNDRNDAAPAPGTTHWHYSSVAGAFVSSTDTHPSDFQSGGYDTMDPAATAKNILTVGAVNDIPAGWVSPASVVQSTFSSWGPTDDGRVKPDIVGNGVGLYSAHNASNTAYATLDGTSMATPNVAGSINLLSQAWKYWGGWAFIADEAPAPRSATIKAIVINTADEAGGANGPDYQNGWGLMNTERAMDTIAHNIVTNFAETYPALGDMGAGETNLVQNTGDAFYFEVNSPNRLPRITIAWTDPAGPVQPYVVDPGTTRLVNDLDIRMVRLSDGGVNSPWVLNPALPANAATLGDNTRDNVEKINMYNPLLGKYQLRVTHKGASLVNGSQNYSIAWHDITPMQPPQPTPGSVISVDSHPSAPVAGWTRDSASAGYYMAALKDFSVTSIGIKADLLQKQTLTVNIYASTNQVRGALLATASATVYHPGEVYQYVPINFTFQGCTEYDVSVAWGEVRQLPGFSEVASPAPFDLGGAFRILNGEYNGSAGDGAFVRLSFIGSAVSPDQVADLDPQQGTPLLNAGGGPDSNQGRGFYFRANQTVAMCAFGMEVDHAAGQKLTANLYAATGTTRGALLATGQITVPSTGLMWHDVPLNYLLQEGEEYDLEMFLGDTSLWHWWSESLLTRPYVKGPIMVVDGELNGNAGNSALPHFRVSYDEGVGAVALDITTPFLGAASIPRVGGLDGRHSGRADHHGQRVRCHRHNPRGPHHERNADLQRPRNALARRAGGGPAGRWK
jgi:hypothetical protein